MRSRPRLVMLFDIGAESLLDDRLKLPPPSLAIFRIAANMSRSTCVANFSRTTAIALSLGSEYRRRNEKGGVAPRLF
jgi:hypothetical protein